MENSSLQNLSNSDLSFIVNLSSILPPKQKEVTKSYFGKNELSEDLQVFLSKVNSLWEQSNSQPCSTTPKEFLNYNFRKHILSDSNKLIKTYLAFAKYLPKDHQNEVTVESIKKLEETLDKLSI